jgi:hypothetical protein
MVDKNDFDGAFDQQEEGKSMEDIVELSRFESPIGATLQKLFNEYEIDRKLTEERWIKDLRQYRGELNCIRKDQRPF